MEQQVFLIYDGDEQCIGSVLDILGNDPMSQNVPAALFLMISCIVEEAVLGAKQVNTIPLALELR